MTRKTHPPFRLAFLPPTQTPRPRGSGFAASGPGYYVWQPERLATASWVRELDPTRTSPLRKRPTGRS